MLLYSVYISIFLHQKKLGRLYVDILIHTPSCVNSLLTPMAEDEYAWDGDKSTFVVNLLSALNSIISITTFMGARLILKW